MIHDETDAQETRDFMARSAAAATARMRARDDHRRRSLHAGERRTYRCGEWDVPIHLDERGCPLAGSPALTPDARRARTRVARWHLAQRALVLAAALVILVLSLRVPLRLLAETWGVR